MHLVVSGTDYDVLIDGGMWKLHTLDELEWICGRATKLQGIGLNRDRKVIAMRLWEGLDDKVQQKFERSKFGKSLGVDFAGMRARRGEG